MKILRCLLIVISIFSIIECSGGKDPFSQDDDNNSSNQSYSIPTSLKGKTLKCTQVTSEEAVQNFTFSLSSFTANYGSSSYFIAAYATSYTYTKTGSNSAKLKMSYQSKMTVAGNSSTYKYQDTFTLTFTSVDGGYLSGTSVLDANSTYTYSYEPFTLQ